MRVAVIGGGMAGLCAAHQLLRDGAEATLFEAGSRAGGKVGSRAEHGFLTEDGPNFLARPLDALIDATRLRDKLVAPRRAGTRWVHLGGRVVRAPSIAFLRAAGLPRALLEPLFARPLREDLPLRTFLAQRLGERAGALVAALMAAGVYAGDPRQLSARDAFPSLGAMAAQGSLLAGALRSRKSPRRLLWNLRGGLGALPDALAASLGPRLRLGARISKLSQARDGWQVGEEPFDAVILAVPSAAAAALCSAFAPRFAEAASSFRSASVAVVHLGFSAREVPRGFGLLDADASLHCLGALFLSSMLPGRAPAGQALVTAICGGALHPERAALPDAELIAAVQADLRATLGIGSAPSYARIVRWPEGIPQYAPGHRERVAAARAALRPFARIELAGAAYDGVGVPDVAESGAAAARRLLGS